MPTMIINRKAGLARRLGRAEITRRLTIAEGPRPEILWVSPREILAVAGQVLAQEDTLWLGGGDGTLRTVAPMLLHQPHKALAPLPLGTMNLLARDLGVPLALTPAVRALHEAPVTAIDVGRLNGTLFLNKSALGLYPEMIIDRDRRRRLFGYGKWRAMARAAWRVVRRHRLMTVSLTVEGAPRTLRTPALVVATNAYRFRPGRVFFRPDMADGTLTVYVSHRQGWMGSAWQLFRLVTGTLTLDDPALETLHTPRLAIDFKRSRPVANDGEVDFIHGPLAYEVLPAALRVRHPNARPGP